MIIIQPYYPNAHMTTNESLQAFPNAREEPPEMVKHIVCSARQGHSGDAAADEKKLSLHLSFTSSLASLQQRQQRTRTSVTVTRLHRTVDTLLQSNRIHWLKHNKRVPMSDSEMEDSSGSANSYIHPEHPTPPPILKPTARLTDSGFVESIPPSVIGSDDVELNGSEEDDAENEEDAHALAIKLNPFQGFLFLADGEDFKMRWENLGKPEKIFHLVSLFWVCPFIAL